ncbi:glutathione S-transferase N-terminal domain-containing protein [Natrinema salsiterrestre]|uniref:Glutathione S-transferase N-terminal domain-containing protein n=1 Tax=Natrinema salsiterrestre TaxID=2950540 RepID=A0A9Q4L3T9_9EURY|nr:glutathione S-transferase N-terminal domain-containing protein [Natrinema salsiterrestre]MDF9747097.1 glutathione S-transferase N-terminal domain-containing protein [Natrinema salsiterrestre]
MLELYQFEGCPHCKKVREKLSELGISYVNHNPRLGKSHDQKVTNQQTHEELVEVGGMDQVPYLVDTQRETSLYESDDIVEHLETYYG